MKYQLVYIKNKSEKTRNYDTIWQALKERGAALCDQQFFRHRWNDGWEALVEVRTVDAREARQIRRKTDFCGYDWMIDSIIEHGEIKTPER